MMKTQFIINAELVDNYSEISGRPENRLVMSSAVCPTLSRDQGPYNVMRFITTNKSSVGNDNYTH